LKKFVGVARSIGPDYVIAFRVNGAVVTLANCDFALSAEVEYASL
jgi:hypothetical protein